MFSLTCTIVHGNIYRLGSPRSQISKFYLNVEGKYTKLPLKTILNHLPGPMDSLLFPSIRFTLYKKVTCSSYCCSVYDTHLRRLSLSINVIHFTVSFWLNAYFTRILTIQEMMTVLMKLWQFLITKGNDIIIA